MEADNFETGAPNTKEWCYFSKYSVFSRYLISRFRHFNKTERHVPTTLRDVLTSLCEKSDERILKPRDVLCDLKGSTDNHMLLFCVINEYNNIKYDENFHYLYPKELLAVCQKFIDIVLFGLIECPWFETHRVHVRIVCSMVQKLENEGIINSQDKYKLVDHFLALMKLVEYELICEELPF